jgi:hypothetical protein
MYRFVYCLKIFGGDTTGPPFRPQTPRGGGGEGGVEMLVGHTPRIFCTPPNKKFYKKHCPLKRVWGCHPRPGHCYSRPVAVMLLCIQLVCSPAVIYSFHNVLWLCMSPITFNAHDRLSPVIFVLETATVLL